MRNTRWLRFGLASLTLIGAGFSALLVACSSDDDNGTVTPNNDAGGGSDTGTADTGTTDSGGDAGAPVLAKLTVVNAATDLGPDATTDNQTNFQAARICFAISPNGTQFGVSGVPPQPETAPTGLTVPGLYVGTGGKLPSFGLDLATVHLQPYIMNATSLAKHGVPKNGTGGLCDQILATDAGGAYTFKFPDDQSSPVEGVDFWKLPAITPNTFQHDKSYALLLTGCVANATVDAAKCGPGFTASEDPGLGNLKVNIFELNRVTKPAADAVGAQFIHGSSSAAAFLQAAGPVPVQPGFVTDPAAEDPGFKAITDLTGTNGVAYASPATALKEVTGVDFAANYFTANPAVETLAIKLADIQTLSGLPAGTYKNGASFTFIAIGDPDPAVPATIGTTFNLRKFHYLAFPNDPVIENYTPAQ